jgi:hypothetical protein
LETQSTEVEASIRRQLSREHRVHDSILKDVELLVQDDSFPTAAKRFGELQIHLGRHIAAEEELFNRCETLSAPRAILSRLRLEHGVILELAQSIGQALNRREKAPDLSDRIHHLQREINAHEELEWSSLFPGLERLLPNRDRYRELLLKLTQS